MAYVAVASAKASPGVTTSVAALAAMWPVARELVVAELDPSGGDLAVRFDLAPEPGLVSLAAAGRRQLAPDTLRAHTQDLPTAARDGVRPRRALVGPMSGDQATAALTALRSTLPAVLADLCCDVLVDCGRLDPQSPAFEVATKADLLILVTRPVVAEVHHLAARLASTRATSASVLLVGDRPYSVVEVADAVGANPLGTLPVDGRAALALAGGRGNPARALRRSPLLREAAAVAEGLATWLGPLPGDAAADEAPGSPGAPHGGQPGRRIPEASNGGPSPAPPGRPGPTAPNGAPPRPGEPVPHPVAGPPPAGPPPAGPRPGRPSPGGRPWGGPLSGGPPSGGPPPGGLPTRAPGPAGPPGAPPARAPAASPAASPPPPAPPGAGARPRPPVPDHSPRPPSAPPPRPADGAGAPAPRRRAPRREEPDDETRPKHFRRERVEEPRR